LNTVGIAMKTAGSDTAIETCVPWWRQAFPHVFWFVNKKRC
jgi:hypothetical protein